MAMTPITKDVSAEIDGDFYAVAFQGHTLRIPMESVAGSVDIYRVEAILAPHGPAFKASHCAYGAAAAAIEAGMTLDALLSIVRECFAEAGPIA